MQGARPRVALVTLVTTRLPTGVLEAVRGQANIAARAQLPLDLVVVNPERDEAEGALRFERYRSSVLGPRADKFTKLRRLRSARGLEQYDVLMLRYPQGLDLDPLALFRGSSQKIVTIHHTKDLEEFLSERRLANYVRWMFERVNGTRILRRVAGIVGVTDEVRDYELARIGEYKPSATVANGIDVSRIKLTGFRRFDGRHLRLFFVGSDPSPWHGVERLLTSLAAYRGAVSITCDVVGNLGRPAGTEERHGHALVRFHGTLRGAQLDEVAADANLAVGSLGAFVKRMRQGCGLKIREYVARGLPFFVGYEDVDIPANFPFALQVPNANQLLDWDLIIEFAQRMASRDGVSEELRAYAQRNLDWSTKLAQLVEFAQSL